MFKRYARKIAVMASAVAVLAVSAVTFAEPPPEPIVTELGTMFSDVTDIAVDGLMEVLPYAAILLGVFIAIRVAMTIYKRVSRG